MTIPPLSRISRLLLPLLSSIRVKLLIIFAALAVIPIIVVGVVSYARSFSTLQGSITRSTMQISDQMQKSMEMVFLDAEKLLKIGSHPTIIRFVNPYRQTEEGTYRAALEIIQLFKLFRQVSEFGSNIQGIYVIGFNGNCISEREGRYRLPVDPQSIETVRRILGRPGQISYIPNDTVDYGPAGYRDVISVGRAIVRPATRDLLGVIIVDVSRSAIAQLCQNIHIGQTGYFSIITPDKQFIYPPGMRFRDDELSPGNLQRIIQQASGTFIETRRPEKELFTFATIESNGWRIIGRVKQREILRSAYDIRGITLAVVMLSIFLIVILYFFISGALTHPLRELKNTMAEAEKGNLEVRAVSRNRDEIGDLSHGFNVMIEKIRNLLETSLREHEMMKRYELKALQAQINPHFLYNTLDAIVWMTEANNKEEVVKITQTLSSFFRIALSKGQEWISLRNEMEHVQSYLTIQKMRYRDILDYRLDFEEKLFDCRILKLTLQPLVENAIYHGIKNKRGGGLVGVTGRLEDGAMVLEVCDDGPGMPLERLVQVRRELAEDSTEVIMSSGYGLRNVNQRIRLYYGREWGITVHSESGRGTRVTVRVPAMRETHV